MNATLSANMESSHASNLPGVPALALALAVVGCAAPTPPPPTPSSIFATGLGDPAGLAIAANGHLFVADAGWGEVVVFDAAGGFRFAFGKTGHFGNSAPGELYFPGGLAIDRGGRVSVADTHNFRVQVFSATGEVEAVFGRQGTWVGEFDHAFGIAVDPRRGLVYVVDDHIKLDGGGRRVMVFAADGGSRGWFRAPEAQPPLYHPFDVAVAADGRLLVSERNVGRIRVLLPVDFRGVSTTSVAPGTSRPSIRPSSRPSSRSAGREGRENE